MSEHVDADTPPCARDLGPGISAALDTGADNFHRRRPWTNPQDQRVDNMRGYGPGK